MTTLSCMRPDAFAPYAEAAIAGHAEDNVLSGRWPANGSIERARTDFETSLPRGLATTDKHLLEIRAGQGRPRRRRGVVRRSGA